LSTHDWIGPPTGETIVAMSPLIVASALLTILVFLAARSAEGTPGAQALAVAGPIDDGRHLRSSLAPPGHPGRRAGLALGFGNCLGGRFRDPHPLAARHGEGCATPAGLFMILTVFTMFMTMGPIVHLPDGGVIPCPSILLCRLPGFSAVRVSSRWGIAWCFCLATTTGSCSRHSVAGGFPRLLQRA